MNILVKGVCKLCPFIDRRFSVYQRRLVNTEEVALILAMKLVVCINLRTSVLTLDILSA